MPNLKNKSKNNNEFEKVFTNDRDLWILYHSERMLIKKKLNRNIMISEFFFQIAELKKLPRSGWKIKVGLE